MSIFDSLVGNGLPGIQNGSRNGSQQRMSPMQMLFKLKNNPKAILSQAGFNIPSTVNDPGDGSGYMKYLRETGQVDEGMLGMIQNVVSNRSGSRR